MNESKVLFLYTRQDQSRSEELKDFLRMKLGSHVTLNSIQDTLESNSTLEDELFQSRCVVLVYSDICEDYLQHDIHEFQKSYVTFDGSIIKAYLLEDSILSRVVVVYFEKEPDKWIANRMDQRMFHLAGDCFEKLDPALDQFVQTVKTLTRKQQK
ncbi:uncharacterized protein LOC116618157 [Nematostella vectensis]|uniref:uncharacterized protein LOC116618157 n=1 Tax=Nematostella vectensis TaxID=45351 RepID=UPI002077098B|nr:uncharacterized protein LOC116618157 [Nematostella vectensis]XP_048582148.1 uncharacterized protein LOC116618157 [Nematostella vectensis]